MISYKRTVFQRTSWVPPNDVINYTFLL